MVEVVEVTERVFRRYLSITSGKPSSKSHLKEHLLRDVLEQLYHLKLFETLNDHIFDNEILDNHVIKWSKSIIEKYLCVRLRYEAYNSR